MRQLSLDHLAMFAGFVEHKSMRRASAALNISLATFSRKILELERMLGIALTTRQGNRVTPSEMGMALYQRIEPMLREIRQALADLHARATTDHGTIRLGAPVGVTCALLLPAIVAFLDDNTRVCIELVLKDEHADLARDRLNLAIVEGDVADSDLLIRRLISVPRRLVASDDYIARHGAPRTLADLVEHSAVLDRTREHTWCFDAPGGKVAIDMRGRLTVDTTIAVAEAVGRGGGLGLLPAYIADPMIEAQALRRLDIGAEPLAEDVSAVYSRQDSKATLVRSVVHHLAAALAPQRSG